MSADNPTEILETILRDDPRYPEQAYEFVREGLDFTVRKLDKPRHVSGRELLEGIRDFALQEFGPMAKTILSDWGIKRTEDIGEIVFNMVESGLLGKTDEDSREDFKDGYDFETAFRKPFLPKSSSEK